MLNSLSNLIKENSLMRIFCSFSVFLFSAISLVVPSGFSYGALLLVLGSIVLLRFRPSFSFQKHDWIFVLTLAGYFFINVLSNLYHGLPANAYDNVSRYLLAIPVYFLLILYNPEKNYFWFGVVFAAISAAIFTVYQKYAVVGWWGRPVGYMNAIQFGDIALLMASFSLCGCLWFFGKCKNIYFSVLCFFSSLLGLMVSLFSWSRGGWLAIPFVILSLYQSFDIQIRRKYLFYLPFFLIFTFFCYLFLPENNLFKARVLQTDAEVISYIRGDENKSATVSTRMKMWEVGLDAFKFKPIFGWGDLNVIKQQFSSSWVEINRQGDFNHLHNEYIDALAKKGLVGFAALMAMYLVPLYYFIGLMRTRQADVMPFAAAGVVLILCVMVFGLTQCFLAHNSGTMTFVFYLVIIKAYCRNIVEGRAV